MAEPDRDRRDFIKTVAAGSIGATFTAHHIHADDAKSFETSNQLAGQSTKVELTINGQAHTLDVDTRVTLLDALRETLQLTGTKKGCDHGQCGACTVLVNDQRVNACLTLAATLQNKKVTTIEGLADGDELHPMQAAFIKHDAFQCGYCTPGQICSAVGLINEGHAVDDDSVRELMSGNICRCGAYPNILAAIQEVRSMKGEQS